MEHTAVSSSFTLSFPEDSGFSGTGIICYQGTPAPDALFAQGSDTPRLFVTDSTVVSLPCMRQLVARCKAAGSKDILVVLGSGESCKTIDSVLQIVRTALEHNLNRNALFVGIGGGVICDMTAFAASIFKRGVQCELVPTTLLADVDAAIGGKTGCDFESYKNMIGTFYPARNVHIWSDFVLSLPEREFLSGLAEAIKTALLFSEELCALLRDNKDAVRSRDSAVLARIIGTCAEAKARVVHKDLREHGERAFLNLGHTFGHALESVAGLGTVTHGEGVAWGMARAAALSARLGICPESYAAEVRALLDSYGYDTAPVPRALAGQQDAEERLLNAMRKDKKNLSASGIRVIVQQGYCKTLIRETDESDIRAVLRA